MKKSMRYLAAAAAALVMIAAVPFAVTAETADRDESETELHAVQDADGGSTENVDSSKVADQSDMVSVKKVTEEGMTPVYGGQIKDGTYPIEVKSSSSMFRVTDAQLTVKDGKMTAVMTMGGKGYLYVYMGTGEQAAAADASEYIGFEENADGAHTFTVPVEALDEAVSCAAFSKKKEKWYDRSLCFLASSIPSDAIKTADIPGDGEYTAEVTLTGGSGRATVESPAKIVVKDGKITATVIWSSPNYDYMIVGGEKYMPVELDGVENSAFEIPVAGFDFEIPVKADTTAMSQPHEISYTLNFDSASLEGGQSGMSGTVIIIVIAVLVLIALIGGVIVGRKIAVKLKNN